jgi:hypothetical protein
MPYVDDLRLLLGDTVATGQHMTHAEDFLSTFSDPSTISDSSSSSSNTDSRHPSLFTLPKFEDVSDTRALGPVSSSSSSSNSSLIGSEPSSSKTLSLAVPSTQDSASKPLTSSRYRPRTIDRLVKPRTESTSESIQRIAQKHEETSDKILEKISSLISPSVSPSFKAQIEDKLGKLSEEFEQLRAELASLREIVEKHLNDFAELQNYVQQMALFLQEASKKAE